MLFISAVTRTVIEQVDIDYFFFTYLSNPLVGNLDPVQLVIFRQQPSRFYSQTSPPRTARRFPYSACADVGFSTWPIALPIEQSSSLIADER